MANVNIAITYFHLFGEVYFLSVKIFQLNFFSYIIVNNHSDALVNINTHATAYNA